MSAFISKKKNPSLELKKKKERSRGVAEVHGVHTQRFIGLVTVSFQEKKPFFLLLIFCFLRDDSI